MRPSSAVLDAALRSMPDVATLEMNSGSRMKTAERDAERDEQHQR